MGAAATSDGLVPGCHQSREVSHGSAGDEAASGSLGHAGQVGYPSQGLVLGVDGTGAVEPPGGRHCRCTHNKVKENSSICGSARNPREVAGMVDREAGWRQVVSEDGECCSPAQPLLCDGHSDSLAKPVGGHRRVYRWLHANPVERILEHRLRQLVGRLAVFMHTHCCHLPAGGYAHADRTARLACSRIRFLAPRV